MKIILERILIGLVLALGACGTTPLQGAKLTLGMADIAHHAGAIALQDENVPMKAKMAIADAETVENPAFEALWAATMTYLEADLKLDTLKAAKAAGEDVNVAKVELQIALDALEEQMRIQPENIQKLVDAVNALKKGK